MVTPGPARPATSLARGPARTRAPAACSRGGAPPAGAGAGPLPGTPGSAPVEARRTSRRPGRHRGAGWAKLLRQVVAFVHEYHAVARILTHLERRGHDARAGPWAGRDAAKGVASPRGAGSGPGARRGRCGRGGAVRSRAACAGVCGASNPRLGSGPVPSGRVEAEPRPSPEPVPGHSAQVLRSPRRKESLLQQTKNPNEANSRGPNANRSAWRCSGRRSQVTVQPPE